IGVGCEIGGEECENGERWEHPAIRTILAFAWADVGAGKHRRNEQHDIDDDEHRQRGVREEGSEPALTEDGGTEEDEAGEDCDKQQLPVLQHGRAPISPMAPGPGFAPLYNTMVNGYRIKRIMSSGGLVNFKAIPRSWSRPKPLCPHAIAVSSNVAG